MNWTPSRPLKICICLFTALATQATTFADTPSAVNYREHVAAIFQSRCLGCHGAQKRSGGLSLATFGEVMAGGSGGAVVVPGDPDNSRLWLLVSHEDQPAMPPDQDPIPEDKQQIIRSWILQGAVEKSGDTPRAPTAAWAYQAPPTAGQAILPDPERMIHEPVTAPEKPGAVASLACSPVAPLLAITGQQQILLYHLDSQRLLGILPFPGGSPNRVRFTSDGAVLIAGGGHHAQSGWTNLYDVRTGELLGTVGQQSDTILDADADTRLQRVVIGGPQRVLQSLRPDGVLLGDSSQHNNWIQAVAISPNGETLVTADRNGALFVRELMTFREIFALSGHKGGIEDIDWRADSKVFASAGRDGTVRLWDAENGKQLRSINAHDAAMTVDFTNDGRVASGGQDGQVKLWDENGKPIRSFGPAEDVVLAVAVSQDNTTLVAGDWRGNVTQWRISDGQRLADFGTNPTPLRPRLTQATLAVTAAEQRANQLDSQLASIYDQLTAAANKYAAALDNASATNEQLVQLTELASGKQNNSELPPTELQAQLEAARSAADQFAEDLRLSTEKRTELTAELNQLSADAKIAKQQYQHALQKADWLNNAIQRFDRRWNEVAQSVSESRQEVLAAESQCQTIETALAALRRLVADMEAVNNEPKVESAKSKRDKLLQASLASIGTVEQQLQHAEELLRYSKSSHERQQKQFELLRQAYPNKKGAAEPRP